MAQWLRIHLPIGGRGFDPWSGTVPQAEEPPRLLKPTCAGACTLQTEASNPQLEESPHSPQLEQSPHSNEDPAQPQTLKVSNQNERDGATKELGRLNLLPT